MGIKKRIMVVDDESGTRRIIQTILEKNDYDVTILESAEDALKMLEQDNRFDLILMDNLMMEMTGVEALEVIRKEPSTSHMKVIILSALSEADAMAEAFAKGAADYIFKPVQPIELLNRIEAQFRLSEILSKGGR